MREKSYPSDVGDEEWAFVALYLTLMSEDAPQRGYALRGAGRHLVADAAQRFAAVDGGVPANVAVAESRRLRNLGA